MDGSAEKVMMDFAMEYIIQMRRLFGFMTIVWKYWIDKREKDRLVKGLSFFVLDKEKQQKEPSDYFFCWLLLLFIVQWTFPPY